MDSNAPPPAAFARHSWLPQNANRVPTLASSNSEESIISQMPLPFHLPVDNRSFESGSENSPTVPQQPWGQSPQFTAQFSSQPQMLAHPSPLNPSTVYPIQQQMGHGYPMMNPMAGQEYNGYVQQPQMSQSYHLQHPQQMENLHQPQSFYHGDQFVTAPMSYQQGSFQYPQQFQYGPSSGYNVPQVPNMAYHEPAAQVMSGFEHNQAFAQNYDPRNVPNQNHYPFGLTHRRDSQSQVNRMLTHENRGFMQNNPQDRNRYGNDSQIHNRPTLSRGFSGRASSIGLPSGPALGRTTSLNGPRSRDFRGRGKLHNPRNVSAGYDSGVQSKSPTRPPSRQGSEPPKVIPQFRQNPTGPLKDNVVLTPMKVTSSPPKNPTPVTARQLGETTPNVSPALRSRRNQSVARASVSFKIDPIKGPPPSFWPGGKPPVETSEELSPRSKITRTRSSTALVGQPGPDPFITKSPGALFGTQVLSQPVNSALKFNNPFEQVIAPSGPIVSLLLNQRQEQGGPSRHMSSLCPNGIKPVIDVAFDPQNMPFVEPARQHSGLYLTGVVRISNIPYSVTRQEIMAFLGRNARMINEVDEPIHIIMERVTSKTMDAYVEFINISEAVNSVNRYDMNRSGGRGGRLGERHVDLEVVGHEHLMRDLFPKAKNVHWNGSEPHISLTDLSDEYNTGFKGFITREELVMMVKHVETPQRSPFSRECPQRPYECLISTLIKYPWHMVDYITLEDRNLLFSAARDLTYMLQNRINDGSEDLSINSRLLKRVHRAIFNCDGFSEAQKDDLAFICGIDPVTLGLPPYADHWNVFHIIGAKRGWESDVIQYYMALLREATTSSALVTLAERSANGAAGSKRAFGNINIEYPEELNEMSLAAIGHIEWDVIEALLRKVLQE